MPLGVLPMMKQQEANTLIREGYEPIEWVTPRMIAEFWDCTRGVIASAASRNCYEKIQQVKIGKKSFYWKLSAFTAYVPMAHSDEVKFNIMRSLPGLIQEEIDSGIYGIGGYTQVGAENTYEIQNREHAARSARQLDFNPNAITPEQQEAERKSLLPSNQGPKVPLKQAERFPKRKKFEKDYLEALADIVELHDWENIVVRAVNDAVNGNAKARTWLADYLIGKPITRIASIQKVENTRMAEDERKELLQGIFNPEFIGEPIEDVEAEDTSDRDDDPDTEETSGRDFGSEHVVGSPFKK